MPRRENYYDPIIDDGSQQGIELRGFTTNISGTFVLLDDVITAIRLYAESWPEQEYKEIIHEVATWLVSGEAPPQIVSEQEPPPVDPDARFKDTDPGDMTPDVGRVEVFPDEEGKWYARSVDTGGNIMRTTNGSYDKQYVIKNAEHRWPGIPIYEVANAMADSMWEERGRMGPSPKRLWR